MSVVTGQNQRERAAQLLSAYSADLNPTDKLSTMGAAFAGEPEAFKANLDEIAAMADDHHRQFTDGGSPSAAAWARGGLLPIIGPPIVALLRAGHVADAMKILIAWSGVAEHKPPARYLVGVMDQPTGFSWSSEGVPAAVNRSEMTVVEYQQIANSALDTAVTVAHADTPLNPLASVGAARHQMSSTEPRTTAHQQSPAALRTQRFRCMHSPTRTRYVAPQPQHTRHRKP